jgi:hypothetical protein
VSIPSGFPVSATTGFKNGPLANVHNQSGTGWHYDSRGWVEIDGAGVTPGDPILFENWFCGVNVDVAADNVTINNCHITYAGPGDSWGVSLRSVDSATVSNCTIAGSNAGNNRMAVCVKDIYGDSTNTQVLACDMSWCAIGVQLQQGLIKDNYIHALGMNSTDHVNGTTANGGNGLQLTIQHNTVLNPFGQTDAISLFQDFSVQSDATITDNFVAGGDYCIYGGDGGYGATSNIVITNNLFSTMYFADGGDFGPFTAFTASGSGNEWSGNTWYDGPNAGQTITA